MLPPPSERRCGPLDGLASALVVVIAASLLGACAGGRSTAAPSTTAAPNTTAAATTALPVTATSRPAPTTTAAKKTLSTATVRSTQPGAPPASATVSSSPGTAGPTGARPLLGKVVGIDPGHNGLNYTDPTFLDQQIWNGREYEDCDTTGTETDSGYTEAQFNFNVATYLDADLEREGADVVMTRDSNDGVGPCVNTRAQIIDDAHAAVAVDVHADGGPPGGRGFAILEPVADGTNNMVIGPSDAFALDVRNRFLAMTGMPLSDYDGVDGLQPRDDLAGLNLTTVPKILIECGNMRNATDAAVLTTVRFQEVAAAALASAITQFLT